MQRLWYPTKWLVSSHTPQGAGTTVKVKFPPLKVPADGGPEMVRVAPTKSVLVTVGGLPVLTAVDPSGGSKVKLLRVKLRPPA